MSTAVEIKDVTRSFGELVAVDGVTDLSVDLEAKTVSVTGGDDVAIIAAIDEAGFDVAR